MDALSGVLDDLSRFGISIHRLCGFKSFNWENIDRNCYATALTVWAQLGSAWSFLMCTNLASGDDLL